MSKASTTCLTRHAQRRAHQRAARVDAIARLMTHADTRVPIGGGCQSLSISGTGLAGISDIDAPAQLRERLRGLAVLTDPSGTTVITVLRPRGWRGRRYRHRYDAHRTTGANVIHPSH